MNIEYRTYPCSGGRYFFENYINFCICFSRECKGVIVIRYASLVTRATVILYEATAEFKFLSFSIELYLTYFFVFFTIVIRTSANLFLSIIQEANLITTRAFSFLFLDLDLLFIIRYDEIYRVIHLLSLC